MRGLTDNFRIQSHSLNAKDEGITLTKGDVDTRAEKNYNKII